MNLASLPKIGEQLEGGIFGGLTTTAEGIHCAVVLMEDQPESRPSLTDAKAFADRINAVVPTRPVAALLFVTLKSEFEDDWYWTADELNGSFAWVQNFYDGDQNINHKSYESRARFVRLIQLTA